MTDLRKWLPFKFNRSDKPAKAEASPAPVQPTRPATLYDEINRMMNQAFSGGPWGEPFGATSSLGRWFGDFAPRTFVPSVDVVDEGQHVKVSAELPGMDRENIQLSVDEGILTIRGEKSEESTSEEGCYRTERYYGSFRRAIPLPVDVDTAAAEASFDAGVLHVRFPKTEPKSASRTIDIKGA